VYCHNPELIPVCQPPTEKSIQPETIIDYLQKHLNVIEGVCITGGEPTIHPDLPELIQTLKRLGLRIKLDTNGLHPEMIQTLLDRRLVDFIAMDLKHAWNRYPAIIGINQPQVITNCERTFALIQASSIPHEFRTTVYSAIHSPDDLVEIADQLQDGERYVLQAIRFQKTLRPNLAQTPPHDLEHIIASIRSRRPLLQLETRV
jgi:pyruvate formate lyase activating enzyme